MSDLKSRLVAVAAQWAVAHGDAPLSRLGKRVASDATFFDRLGRGGGLNLATLERFALFLIDPANWPELRVPQEARDLAHSCGVSLRVKHPAGADDGVIHAAGVSQP